MQPTNCLNCGQALTGTYCSQCGQKETHRYSVKHVMHELVHVFTHADKGIFSFAWNILRKPGVVALDLVEGRRKRYFNLFQYLLLIVGFVTFLILKFDVIGHTLKNINDANATTLSERQLQAQQEATYIIQKYNNILQLLLIPVYAFFSWLFVERKRYNFAERLVLHAASSAQSNTLAIVTTALMVVLSSVNGLIITGILSLGVMLFSFTISYKQFFKFSLLKSFGFSVLVFVCSYVVQIFLIGAFVALYTILFVIKK